MPFTTPVFTALDPGLYFIPVAQIWVRPWVQNPTTGVWAKGTGDFINVGDCDEFKTSFATTRQTRYARNERVRTKVIDRVTQVDMSFSFKAMQHSALIRAMALLANIEDADENAPSEQINIGEVAQHDLEVLVVNVGEQGPEGKMLLHRCQSAPDGDHMWGGPDEFTGVDFKGSVLKVPTLGIGA